MPFTVKKVGDKYKLWKPQDKTFAKPSFNTREAAINAGKNYMRYHNEKSKVKGNKILKK